jgi:hypothetical protein
LPAEKSVETEVADSAAGVFGRCSFDALGLRGRVALVVLSESRLSLFWQSVVEGWDKVAAALLDDPFEQGPQPMAELAASWL